MRKIIISIAILLLLTVGLFGYELLELANAPTAGILQHGEVEIVTKMYRSNSIMMGASVGLFPRFMFGISYGGENLVGNLRPEWYEKVEVNVKYRILDEAHTFPAVVVGFESQGHGEYYSELKRYDIKSKGFYASASKNYLLFGNLGLHLGTNYSLENKDRLRKMNIFAGVDKSIGDQLTLMLDYDMGLDDKELRLKSQKEEREGYGYLNAAIKLDFNENISIKLIGYDILENNPNTQGADRALLINYNTKF